MSAAGSFLKLKVMKKNVIRVLMALSLVACDNTKETAFADLNQENTYAKELLQGIWLDEESESPLMRVEKDTIYYADPQTAPIAFKIFRDTLFTYGNDTTCYKIDVQTESSFCFHSITDNVVRLRKSEDGNDSLYFARREMVIPTYTEVTKRDSVLMFNGNRYRAYVYINPSRMRVIKTSYSENGISMDNVYYDNVMHICVYEGRKSLFASDITKKLFTEVVPEDFLSQTILSDMRFMKVNRKGFHYQVILAVPETSIYCIADILVSFDGKLTVSVANEV